MNFTLHHEITEKAMETLEQADKQIGGIDLS